MTFFYDLNKRLNSIRELPETTHGRLNESKPDFLDLDRDGDKKEPMKKAAADKKAAQKPDYKSKLQDKFGGSAADLTRGLSIQGKKVDEAGMSRAAKGMEKYGKEGMQALAKAGREGKSLDPVRAKFNKYDESIAESNHSIRDVLAYEIEMILDGAAAGDDQTDHIIDELGDIFKDIKASRDKAAMMAYEMMVDTIDEDADMQAVAARKALALLKNNSASVEEGSYSKDAMELNPDFARVGKKPGVMGKIAKGIKRVADFVAPGDEDLLRDLERKSGGRRPAKVAEETGLNKSVEAASKIINKTDPYSTHVGSSGSNHVFFSGSSGSDEHIYHIFNDKTKDTDTVSFYHEGKPQSLKDIAAAVYDYSIAKIIHGHHTDNLDESVNIDNLDESIDFDKVLDAIAALYGDDIWENDAMQDLANDLEQAGPTDRELDFIIAKGKLPKRLANTQFSAGDNVRFGEAATPMSAKQKSFAALAPPRDKVTFADKIAGAKKEVDEMLGDVAAEAMKSALGKQQVRGMGEATKEVPGGRRHTAEPGGYGRRDDDDAPRVQTQRGRGRPKKGSDSETGEVMKPDFSAFGVGGKVNLPKHKGAVTKHKMVGEDEHGDVEAAIRMLKKAGYTVSKGKKDLDEKAESENQAIAARIAMQHKKDGTKPKAGAASAEMSKMSKADLEDFTKAKPGAPKKVKEENTDTRDTRAEKAGKRVTKDIEYDEKDKDKDHGAKRGPQDARAEKAGKRVAKDIEHDEKVDETTTSGSVATAPAAGGKKAKGGMSFGQGIYDSWNRELENMISESINVSVNISNGGESGTPTKNITVSAEGDDADRLAELLQMAGMGSAPAAMPTGGCGSEQMDENQPAVDENTPDYPTNTEYSDDAFQYSGGLNKPKSTGQTTVPVIASQTDRQSTDEEDDEIDRMMEMAGVKKKAMDEEKTEEGNLFTGNLAKARAAGKKEADLDGDGKMEKVDESIFDMTRNLWKSYNK